MTTCKGHRVIEDNSHHIIHSSFHHATKGKSADDSAAPHGYRCDVESLQDVSLHHAHNYFAKRDCFCLRLCHFSFNSLTFQTPPPPTSPPNNAILCSTKTIKLSECHETTFNIYGRCTIKLNYKCHNDDVNCKFIFCNLCPHLGPFNWQTPGFLPNKVGKMIYANGNTHSYRSLQDR